MMDDKTRKSQASVKRVLCLVLMISLLCSSWIVNADAAGLDGRETSKVIDVTGIADKEEYIEKCIAEYIALRTGNNLQRSDRYYTYRTERGYAFKKVTITGYAQQPEPGYKLDGNGTDGLFWSDSGGPEANGSVAFTFPVKSVTVTVTLGIAGSGSGITGVYKEANQGPGNYKIKVGKTTEVEQVLIYQIDTRNGKETLWDDMYIKELIEVWPQLVKVS